MKSTPIALTIAGTDNSGGAGIQADLKAFSALGAYGASVITALVAQNTQGVDSILDVPVDFIEKQMDMTCNDLSVKAVKIGMLSRSEVIRAIAHSLDKHKLRNIVLDPVMVAKSGDKLLHDEAIETLRETLIPKADLITPNLPEAAMLLGKDKLASNKEEMQASADALLKLGAKAVMVKGGHLQSSESGDLVTDGTHAHWLPAKRIHTQNTHGTGCTLSSAIAAGLANDLDLMVAVKQAKEYIGRAIAAADKLNIGHGHGPVHHFYKWW